MQRVTRTVTVKKNDTLKKLEKAGILGVRQPLTQEDNKVLESLTPEEVDAWVRIKEKLDKAGVKKQDCKFFI